MTVKERSWTSLLINPPFQLKLLSYFVVLFVLTTITLYSTTYLFFWNMKNKGLNVGIPEGHVYYQEYKRGVPQNPFGGMPTECSRNA